MFPIQIKVLQEKPPEATVREWREIQRGTWRAIGDYWYANMLPEHFKPNAALVYGYRKRSKKYLEAKQKALQHGRALGGKRLSPLAATLSLTKSGLLHTAVTTRGRVIRAFPTRFTVTIPGTAYTPARQRSSKQPFLQGELTKLLKREIEVLQKIGKEEALRLINSVRGSKNTTFK